MESLTITLAGPPRGKGRPRFSRNTGFAYTPEGTRSYEGALRHEAAHVMAGRRPTDGPLAVSIVAIFAIPKSWSRKMRAAALAGDVWPTKTPDVDNLMKTIDAMNGIVWRDDKQVVDARVMKVYGDRPRLEIVITPIGERPEVALLTRRAELALSLPFGGDWAR